MALKLEAARERKSVAALVREKISRKTQAAKKTRAKTLLREIQQLARANAKYFKGKSAAEALIEMRYEQ